MTDATNIMHIFICFCKKTCLQISREVWKNDNKIFFGSCDWCNKAQMEDLWPPRIAPDLQMILKEAEAFEA